jgi:hypothetical protein
MANRYLVGGTGTWNTSSTTNWSASSGGASGASVPTASDSVFFDQAATYTVTLTGALACLNLTVSAGTVTFTSTGTIAISGSLSLVAGTVWNATGTITFNSTTTGNTITTNAVIISCSITFDGVGGSWQLQSALTSGSTRTVTLTNGTLDLNGYTLSVGIFASSNSNTRTFAFGTGNLTLTYASVGAGNVQAIWTTTTVTGMTITGTPVVNCTGSTSFTTSTRQLIVGAHGESQSISFNITPSSAASDIIRFATTSGAFKNVVFAVTFTGSVQVSNSIFVYGDLDFGGATVYIGTSTINFAATSGAKTIKTSGLTIDSNVTFNGVGGTWAMQDALTQGSTRALTMTNGTLQLKSGTTSTVGSFATSGTTVKYLQATTPGSQATISDASGTNTVSYLTIQDIAATGGATWNAYSTDNNINAGNNTGWDFFAQLSRYIYTRRKNKVISI